MASRHPCRGEIIRAVEIDGIDRFEGHELPDVDRMGRRVLERLQLLGSEHHILVFGEFVALDHLGALDEFAVRHRDVLLLDARAVLLSQQIERDAFRGDGGGVQLDGYGHEAE